MRLNARLMQLTDRSMRRPIGAAKNPPHFIRIVGRWYMMRDRNNCAGYPDVPEWKETNAPNGEG